MDRCVEYSEHLDKKDPNLVLDFDMEFIDDTYVCTFWGNADCVKGNHVDKTQGMCDSTSAGPAGGHNAGAPSAPLAPMVPDEGGAVFWI